MWDNLFNNYILFLMIFARVAGMILFNPVFGRGNIPGLAKMGLCFFICIILVGILPPSVPPAAQNLLVFMLLCVKELFIGFFAGFIMQLFLTVLILAGDFSDLQLGVGMAKIYDPQSHISMSLIGSVFNIFYLVLFFAAGGHLTFLKIIFYSFDILPLGSAWINPQCGEFIALLFGNILILAIKLALPVIAVEVATEMSLGILMRTVPQINVFAVGLQLKLLVGLVFIALIFPGFFVFFDTLTDTMFQTIRTGFGQIK